MSNDPNYWNLVWDQIRMTPGAIVSPHDLRKGDKVIVSGTGKCGGQWYDFRDVSGVVVRSGWQGNHFEFYIECQEWNQLPSMFWPTPTIIFDNVHELKSVKRY